MTQIPLSFSSLGEEEIRSAKEVLDSGFLTMGKKCLEFEDAFASYLGVRNAVFVNSGSSANLLAFFALANHALPRVGRKRGMRPGDEVIVPAVTWSTTLWPIIHAGGVPVLVDCDPSTFQMSLEDVEAAIGPKTVAICPVHIAGNAVPMKGVHELASRHGLWIVEDSCEALGTRNDGWLSGTTGDIGTYSFFYSHQITTIEGGMLVTPHDELAELFRVQRAHGWTRHLKNRHVVESQYPEIDPRCLFINSGFSVRPTEINAAFGLAQLKKLDGFNRLRSEIATHWIAEFSELARDQMLMPMRATPGTDCTYSGFPVLCRTKETRDAFQAHLEGHGIETRPIAAGNLARQPALKHLPHRISGALRGADQIMDQGLFWSTHPLLKKEEIDHVSKTVKGFFGT